MKIKVTLSVFILFLGNLVFLNYSQALTVQTNGGSTLVVNLAATKTLAASDTSTDFDFSANISRPISGWSDSDLIAAEVALTNGTGDTAGADNAPVFRDDSTCIVDLSNNINSNDYGTTQSGSVTISSNTVFVLNDRSPQLSVQGTIQAVINVLSRVRVQCGTAAALVGKYVRVGVVPTVSSSDCAAGSISGSSATITCTDLYYVFSSQHYYRVAIASANQTISQHFARARTMTIPVDGTNKSGATRYGWVATLKDRDEIILTNAIDSGSRMIGTTDRTNTGANAWTWDINWGGSGTNCETDEGNFRWLGPDVWCERVPTWNHRSSTSYPSGTTTTSQYWIRTNNLWTPTDATSYNAHTGMRINFASTTTPTSESDARNTNGYNVFHSWHTGANGAPDEPNSSGDYIYQGYAGGNNNPGWDDAGESTGSEGPGASGGSAGQKYYVEYCSGTSGNTCTPPDAAVDSIQLKYDQTLTLNTAPAANSEVSTSTSDFSATSSSDLDITYTSSDTSICTVSPGTSGSGTTVTVTLLWANAYCSITVSQGGNVNFNAATSITRTFLSRYGDDIGLRPVNTLPVDPQVTSYNPKSMTVTSGPSQVLVCLNIASSTDGTLLDGVLRIDVGNIDNSDTSFSASGNDVNISSDRTSAVNISGVLASVNTTLRTTTITRVSGGRLSGTYYLRIRSVPTTGDSLNVTCSDAPAASTRTFTLRPMSVGRTRSVSVSLNKR